MLNAFSLCIFLQTNCQSVNIFFYVFFFLFTAERANESIHQLKYALEERQFAEGKDEVGFESSVDKDNDDVDHGNDDRENSAWQDLQHSHAGKITQNANSLKIVRSDIKSVPPKKKSVFLLTINVFISS